jgi:hypothetical protein
MAITTNHQTNALAATSGTATLNAVTPGAYVATATNSISAGDPVVANADATVSAGKVVTIPDVVYNTGTAVSITSATSSVYCSNVDRVAIAYKNNSGIGQMSVAQPSGTTLTGVSTGVSFSAAVISTVALAYDVKQDSLGPFNGQLNRSNYELYRK